MCMSLCVPRSVCPYSVLKRCSKRFWLFHLPFFAQYKRENDRMENSICKVFSFETNPKQKLHLNVYSCDLFTVFSVPLNHFSVSNWLFVASSSEYFSFILFFHPIHLDAIFPFFDFIFRNIIAWKSFSSVNPYTCAFILWSSVFSKLPYARDER